MLESALLFLVFFGPLAFGCVEPWSLSVIQVVLFALLGLSGARPAGRASMPLLAGIGGLLAVGFLQSLHPASSHGPIPLAPFTASAYQTRKALLLWASYGALVWCAASVFGDPRARRRFAWAILLVGFSIAVIGLIQSAHGNKLVLGFREVGYGRSPFGPYYNNAHAASLLAVSLLLGSGLFWSRLVRDPRSNKPGTSPWDSLAANTVIAFILGVNLLALLATRNRGSLLALGGAVLLISLLACGWIKRPVLRWSVRASIVGLYLAVGGGALHLGAIQRGAALSIPYRISMYRSGMKLLADFPLWGTGLGTVISVFEPYKEPLVVGIVDHVHNDWLELPIQAGLPTAALVLAMLAAFGGRVYRGWMGEASLPRRFLVGGGIAASLCFLLHALVEFTWQIPANAVIFLMLLCWLWGQTAGATADARHSSSRGLMIPAAALILALLAVRPAVGWTMAQRERYDAAFSWDADPEYLYRAAVQHLRAGRKAGALAAVEAALRLDPANSRFQGLHARIR